MGTGIEFGVDNLWWWAMGSAMGLIGVFLALRAFEARRRRRIERFVESKLAPRLLPAADAALRRPLTWLTLTGCALMAVALAQPHWGKSWREVRRASRDIVILLDTSESMRAPNPLPNRLERAKHKISALLDRAPGDRFALIAFSGAAALQCPLTLDHAYVKTVLETIDTDTVSQEGTNIASAIELAVEMFEKEDQTSGGSGKASRALVLISDGEDVEGRAVEAATAAAAHTRIFVIGVGDPRGVEVRLPEWMARYVRDSDRDLVHLSKLDEDTLSAIAVAGNGAYARARLDTSDIEDLYDRFQVLATRDASSDIRLRLVNRYQWPLALAILAFAGEGAWLASIAFVRRWYLARPARAARVVQEGREYA